MLFPYLYRISLGLKIIVNSLINIIIIVALILYYIRKIYVIVYYKINFNLQFASYYLYQFWGFEVIIVKKETKWKKK